MISLLANFISAFFILMVLMFSFAFISAKSEGTWIEKVFDLLMVIVFILFIVTVICTIYNFIQILIA